MGKGKTPPGSRKKVTKSHTTAIPLAEKILRVLNRLSAVDKIALGVIKPKLRSGPRRLKIMQEKPTVLLLKIRDTNSLQEMRVYTSDADGVTVDLAEFCKKKGWGVAR